MDSPFGLLAELTHACPLACSYCSNPLELTKRSDELGTDDWRRVLDQAAELGVLQCHLSGGEPLLRRDVVDLVAHANSLGMYTNLVTSAIGLSVATDVPLGVPAKRVTAAASKPGWA